jgi:hypothetical protein
MHTGPDAGKTMAVDDLNGATASDAGVTAAAAAAVASSVTVDSTAVTTSCSADGHSASNSDTTDTEDELLSNSAVATAVDSSKDTVHVQHGALLPEVVVAAAVVEAPAVDAQQPAAVAEAPLQPAVAVVVPVPVPAAVTAVAAPAALAAAAAQLSHLMLLKQSIKQTLQDIGGNDEQKLATIAFLLDIAADTPPVHTLAADGVSTAQLSAAELQQLASSKHMQRFVQTTLASASADADKLGMVKFVTA